MFYLLGGERPNKTVYYEKQQNNVIMQYYASATKEYLHIFEDETCVASFFFTKSNLKGVVDDDGNPVHQEILSVGGDKWKDYIYLVGIDQEQPRTLESEGFVAKPKKTLKKIEGMTYTVKNRSDTHVLQKIGNSVEDYLYTLRDLKEIAESEGLDLSWVNNKNYRLLISDKEVNEFIEGLAQTENLVGFDTETTGLLVGRDKIDILVGMSLSYEDHTGVYIPIAHKRFPNVQMGQDALLEKLKPYIDRNSPLKKPLVTHNGGFDWKVLKMYDIDLNIVHDTFIRQGLKNINEAKNILGLKAIAKRVLKHDVIELDDMFVNRTVNDIEDVKTAVFKKGLQVNDITRYKLERAESFKDLKYDFRFASAEFSELYGAADADFPRLIFAIQEREWDKSLDFIYRLEINLIPVLGEQEYFGVHVQEEGFKMLYDDAVKRLEQIENQIYELAGYKLDLNSPQQVSKLVFDDMGCPLLPRYKTKTGIGSTSKGVLEELLQYRNEDGSVKYPVVDLLMQHSKISKLINSFYGKLPKLVHKGFIYPNYRQLGTETGRIASSNPNAQQTEPSSRVYMVPDTPDHYFMICDYSQVEYRIMGGMSGESRIVDFFKANPEADYHILAYANMMNKPYEDVTSKERKIGKVLNFGTSYGLGDQSLALKLYGEATEFHQRMASETRERYFNGVPTLRDYFEKLRDEAQQRGYAKTLFGRIRYIEEFNYKGYVPEHKIQAGRRKAGNMPVQGTAADIMKIAMVRVHKKIRELFTTDQVRLVMNIHDELVIQVHKSINMWYALSIIRKAMEIDMSSYGFPPLYIGANVGYCWKDGKADHLEAPVLLMNEKMEEVEEKLARGETLPVYDDPRQVWADEISYFALRQVEKEIRENNYTTMAECYKNLRIMKYARHFEVKRVIDGKEKTVSFDNNVISLLLDRNNTAESLWNNWDYYLQQDLVEYHPEENSSSKQAKEIEEETVDFSQLVKQHIVYNKSKNTLIIKLLDMDSEFLTILDSILINNEAIENFKEDQKLLKVRVDIEGSKPYFVRFRGLLSGFLPTVMQMMETHLRGANYKPFINVADRVGNTLLKENLV